MKSSVSRKLILSCCALGGTIICLTSTTYAWFAKNANAWTEEFEVNVKQEEGLKISVDGINYFDSIDKDQLIKAIQAKRLNKAYAAVTEEDLKDAVIEFKPVATKDLESFTIVNSDSKITNGYYTPEAANKAAYVEFDLYFRAIASSSDAKSKYNLIFADEALKKEQKLTYITSKTSSVTLNNVLYVPDYKDLRENPKEKGKYESGETITIDPANAMRIGVIHHENQKTIYEPNMGYASYALANAPADAYESEDQAKLYNPDLNPMITYFNNTHNLGKLASQEYDSFLVNTEKDFEKRISLGEFVRGTDGTYNDVKMTMLLWLEGYDADYLEGVDTSTVHFFLNFTKVEG